MDRCVVLLWKCFLFYLRRTTKIDHVPVWLWCQNLILMLRTEVKKRKCKQKTEKRNNRGNNTDNTAVLWKLSNKAIRVYDNQLHQSTHYKWHLKIQKSMNFSGIPNVCRMCPQWPCSCLCKGITLNLWTKSSCSPDYASEWLSTSQLFIMCIPAIMYEAHFRLHCCSSVHLPITLQASFALYHSAAQWTYMVMRENPSLIFRTYYCWSWNDPPKWIWRILSSVDTHTSIW